MVPSWSFRLNTADFFNSVAARWDRIAIHPSERINHVLDLLGPRPGDRFLDVGSGTGVLIPYVLERIGTHGRLVALDAAERMIDCARAKYDAPNLSFVVSDFCEYRCVELFDTILAYSCYPHFQDPHAFFSSARRLLRDGGRLGIAHIQGRQTINALHAGMDGPFSRPLPSIEKTVRAAAANGFSSIITLDDADYYLFTGEAT
jgi:ubiquinone/menaquinone biosynthesis C-methylase UbiE